MTMEAAAASENPKTLPTLPSPPSVRQLPPSERPPSLPLPRTYDSHWGRPYHPYENTDQRAPSSYSASPREGSHMAESYGRPGSSIPPASRTPNGTFRPVNGAHEGNSNPPPSAYQPSSDFHSRPGSYGADSSHPNGEHHGMQMISPVDGMQPPPPTPRSYPPSTPMAQSHGPYDQGNYYLNQANSQAQSQAQRQRRTTRAQQACDQCRARKAKCDEGRPSCSLCKESNSVCVYKDVPPHKHERSTQLVLDRLKQLDDRFNDMLKSQAEQDLKLEALIRAQKMLPLSPKLKKKPEIAHKTPTPAEQERTSPKAASTSETLTGKHIKDDHIDLHIDDDELSIPIEHTTAAHKLLLWPSIQKLLPERIDADYVMELEEERGPIRPYGRGEGEDGHDISVYPYSPKLRSPSPREDETYQTRSPGTGYGTGLEIYQSNPTLRVPKERQVGGLNASGVLNLDADVIEMHRQSYLQNMHILHPILAQDSLNIMITNFIRTYSPQSKSIPTPLASRADPASGVHRVQKRKRSIDMTDGYPDSPVSDSFSPHAGHEIQRSLDNAIVLLVLALGSICGYKGPIPGPVRHVPAGPFTPVMGEHSLASSNSPPESMPFANHHRRFSTQSTHVGPDPPDIRNMDVIPGMAYYALASDILGNLHGGNDLALAQACLLAALYTGQLAHPFSSHGWIYQAARACQVLVRPRKYDCMPEGPRKDLICLVFWTCLQLESDILAELDLPASGISRLEGRMNFPRGVFAHTIPNEIHAPNTMMMMYYLVQIHLRKVLNRIHTDLYKAEKQGGEKARWSTKIQEALSFNLEQWRSGLPEYMRWEDSDPPAKDINTARMRGKYYGAKYLIHRPLLHHALHPMAPKPRNPVPASSPAQSTVSSSQSQVSPSLSHVHQAEKVERYTSEMGPPVRTPSNDPQPPLLSDLEPKVFDACMVCINAAMNSTVAFDGVEGRPIVTNIFGTAHAQFGNMLVLSATYTSQLSALVDGDKLCALLDRTIKFLLRSQHISPTLRKDAEILTLIRRKLFEQNPQPQPQPQSTQTGSFSNDR
ncbi:hypothetical protein TESG_02247 [Trichophyton tonsurans CBS 112818]|uniref:Zn(2)-C6 fungal-type domain-containing protein n=1 Tax=Trichophyton tonsurans (strain CBS 112818) TaxID=647933 RepID=F2RTU3_TRIT1|nr:hypothetical protein TESG_02247 [Trichophyton tonsurans CBS 112818]